MDGKLNLLNKQEVTIPMGDIYFVEEVCRKGGNMYVEIKLFEPKWVREFNSQIEMIWEGRNLQDYRLVILDRGCTYALAIVSDVPQIWGFPQIVLDGGHCVPISSLKEEVRTALRGAPLLKAVGCSFGELRKLADEEKMHPHGYRGSAELVETFFELCFLAGSEEGLPLDAEEFFEQSSVRRIFFAFWGEKCGIHPQFDPQKTE